MKYLLLLSFFLFIRSALGQVCSGNFGTNIFDSGNFGSGTSQVLSFDPQLAPGYIYTTRLPPNDGYYSIVSSLNLGQVHSSWLTLSDNSADPNGYMMVVNANFEPGLFYEETITGLCENVLYEFSADIFNLNAAWATDRIQANVSFLLDDEVLYSTGDIPRNEKWNTYGFTFTTKPGQTQLKLSLRNNAPGGIGNDLALDNITFRPCGSTALILSETVANICEDGEPIDLIATIIGSAFEDKFIQWQQSFDQGSTWVNLEGESGDTFTFNNLQAGFYYYRYLLADSQEKLENEKCRTFSNTKVVRVIPRFVSTTASICEGLSIPFGDRNIFSTGVYKDTLQNSIGCDSIVTVNLTTVENDLNAFFRVSKPTCDYLADGAIEILSLTSPGPHQLKINGENQAQSWINDSLAAGDYEYVIQDRYGCRLDTTITVSNPPKFEVNLGPDQTLTLGERFQVNDFIAESAVLYDWTPNSIDCDPPCTSIDELFTESTTISLMAISSKRCEATDRVEVLIEGKGDLIIPNVFTPNQDDKNDFFTVFPNEVNGIDIVNELTIYNRSGKIIFRNNSFDPGIPELGWNGTVNGSLAPSGIYYYAADVLFINGESSVYTGFVHLLH
ncbi:MAG: gliding motility-associated C-terminal domain-containing protein [Bacteroidota bacterium]